MKIDIYTHILTPKYLALYAKKNPKVLNTVEVKSALCTDINKRVTLMDEYPDVAEVLTIANPPMDALVSPEDAAELAKIANEELAELVAKYPKKFVAAVAAVPWNNIDVALKEAERAITKLGLKGIQIASRVHQEPLDLPQFKPMWALMSKLDLPIWIHPYFNDKLDWDKGQLSWPFETATAMYRLVNAGIFDEYPNIKFITHHCGSMIPFYYKRVPRSMDYQHFYNDSAVWGNTAALMCGYAYFGSEHILFGTDAPFGPKLGFTTETITSIEAMTIPNFEKEKIFSGNAIKLLKLNI